MSKILDAVSVVMTFNDEIFVIQRQFNLKAFPGYWAFPGGKVDKGDEELAFSHHLISDVKSSLLGAMKREIIEEVGIDLESELGKDHILSIVELGVAITPDFNPYRFATTFFRIDFKVKPKLVVDQNEALSSCWMKAEKLLEKFKKGEILAVPPVIKIIERLGSDIQTHKIPDLNFEYDSSRFVPYLESIYGLKQLMPLSHTLPPATRTNAFLFGDKGSDQVLVDPSPKDESEYQKLLNTIKSFGVNKIVLTHQHPDHYEHSNKLALELKLPIFLSEDSFNRINKKTANYFKGIEIHFLKEGDVLTKWLGHDVKVYEIPGHDEGQLGIAPTNLYWFIAGDLFQGMGSVVIGGDEGDMQKYVNTLKKVIALKPLVIYPSHGIGLGSTFILEKTLEHRLLREEQIYKLHCAGSSEEDILKELYKDVPVELWPYARENISKHLEKLKKDGRI